MEKRKGKSLNSIYRNPLPVPLSVDKYGQLPQLTAHNPISWAVLLFHIVRLHCARPPLAGQPRIRVDAVASGGAISFHVNDACDMQKLWSQCFFGKGTLSRSDPSWKQRVQRRLNLEGSGEVAMTMEEVTNVRRQERRKFKDLRAQAQKYELKLRKQALTEEETKQWEQLKEEMEGMKAVTFPKQDVQEGPDLASMRDEDLSIIDTETRTLKRDLETLQLQKTECFFLSFALNVIHAYKDNCLLTEQQLLQHCVGPSAGPESQFMLDYAVYHHFRSLGWCVRSGIKFGCEYLLYKRGPPFMHAEYAVLVVPNAASHWKNWEDFMAVARVVGGVKKTLVLAYVDVPDQGKFDEAWKNATDSENIRKLFQLYKVTEVIYKRWAPSRTRD